jgi:hypothetical protein
MAEEQAAPPPGHAVTPHVVAGRPIINYRTRANTRSVAHLEPKEPTRATRTSADPPSGRLAGLPADDPVLGDRLGRGHRAAQPAAAITPRPPTIPPIVGNDWSHEMGTATKRRARQLAPVTVAAAPGRRLGAAPWSRAAGRPAEAMVSRRPRPQRRARGFGCGHAPRGTRPRNPRASAPSGRPGAILGADDWFTGWPDGQPASVGNANPRRPAAGQPYSARPHSL